MTLEAFLIAHGSTLILPLAVIEGPIVSVLAGFLSAQGTFTWYWTICLLVAADLIGDLICYLIGRTSRTPLAGLGRRLARRRALVTPALQERLASHATKMLFIGKWTHSIGWLVLIGSGMLRLPLARFLLVNLIATVPKTAMLFSLGYFASGYLPLLERHAMPATVLLCVLGAAAIALILRRADGSWARGAGR